MAKSLKLIVEALLFSSDKPLAFRDINACIPDAKAEEIRSALKVLKYEYEAMGRSYALKEVGGGFQFRSRSEYGAYILRMLQTSPGRLSKAAMETLAIIAYKQPIIRQEIERLRGVDVGGILRTLMEKGLIRIMGRKDLPGRPLIYGTTKKFLEVFDLKNIGALPSLKEMKAFGTAEEGPQAGLLEGAPREETEKRVQVEEDVRVESPGRRNGSFPEDDEEAAEVDPAMKPSVQKTESETLPEEPAQESATSETAPTKAGADED